MPRSCDVLAWSGGRVRLIVFATDRFSAARKMFIESMNNDDVVRMAAEGGRPDSRTEAD